MKKKILAAILAGAMALGLVAVSGGGAATAKAAKNQGLAAVSSFPEATWDTCWNGKCEAVFDLWHTDGAFAVAEPLTLSYTLSISKGLWQDEGDALSISAFVNLFDLEKDDEDNFVGAFQREGNLEPVYDGAGNFSVNYWDAESEKDVKAKFASISSKGDFYVLSVKNMPINGAFQKDEKPVSIDQSKKYGVGCGINICGANGVGGDAVLILDDVKVSAGSKVVYSNDFESGDEAGNFVAPGGNWDNPPAVSGQAYTTSLLSLKSNKATIKVGKKAEIQAVAAAGAKVTYKSDQPKVAAVDKNGRITGKKKGNAVISVTCCGKTVKYTVTVK